MTIPQILQLAVDKLPKGMKALSGLDSEGLVAKLTLNVRSGDEPRTVKFTVTYNFKKNSMSFVRYDVDKEHHQKDVKIDDSQAVLPGVENGE